MKRTILLAASLLLSAFAQQTARFSATTGDVSLSSAGTALTIQQPATNGKQVYFEAAVVYCSVSCSVTQAQNGAAATATAGTANPLMPYGASTAAAATVWTASNVGSGTAAGGITHLSAGQTLTFDLSKISMGVNAGASANYTVSVGSITGTANITMIWGEK